MYCAMRQGKVEDFRRELAATRSEVDEKRLAAEERSAVRLRVLSKLRASHA